MKKNYLFIIVLLCFNFSFAQSVFINEIHYDNTSTDSDEGVEIAGPAGTDLSGYKIELYNGSNGTVYATISLSGTITNQQNGFGTSWFAKSNIQNGNSDGTIPDGLALVDDTNTVIQFLSYEGSFTATDSDANGMASTDILVSESSATPVGSSLQLKGNGQTYGNFIWEGPIASSLNTINTNQTFTAVAAVNREKTLDFSVYPNPIKDGYFMLNAKDNDARKIEIFDVLGKKVYDKTIIGFKK